MLKRILYPILLILLLGNISIAQNQNYVECINEHEYFIVGGNTLEVLEDKNSVYTIEDVQNKKFERSDKNVPNLGISSSTFWVRFSVKNSTENERLLTQLSLATLDQVNFYYQKDGKWNVVKSGEDFPFEQRKYKDPNYIFDCVIPQDSIKTFYYQIASSEGIQLPITVGSPKSIYSHIKKRDILSGLYFGTMLVCIIYNFFIFLSVRDKSYVYYVVYAIIILLTQTSVQGYTFQYLWPNFPTIAKYSLFIFPSLVGMASLLFMNDFLKVKFYHKSLYKISYYFFIPYIISILLSLLGYFNFSFFLMEITAANVSIFMLYTSYKSIDKYSPAKYFFVAWVIFLMGVIIYILKDLELLPFNNFTRYTMQIGSGIETLLLSFALAAKINVYKKERVEALKKNEEMIKERNAFLEQKVEERTVELNRTLSDLKNTQSQLVEAEKMSSLGQLTAGIAHEINNPINFVSSNIFPLRQDIADLKEVIEKYETLSPTEDVDVQLKEIEALKTELDFDYLKEELEMIINGIEEGAIRTSKIVSGLRTFSRLDEGALKDVNINEGIEATLVLINNKLNGVQIKKALGNIPNIECNPGKINQLFMNLIDNSIFAVHKKEMANEEGEVSIKTLLTEDEKVKVIIEDNGIGIPEEIREKLFEPFFTTKNVGEGTGLGLSIVRSIIDDHQGIITVESEVGRGTKIEIVLPQKKKINAQN